MMWVSSRDLSSPQQLYCILVFLGQVSVCAADNRSRRMHCSIVATVQIGIFPFLYFIYSLL